MENYKTKIILIQILLILLSFNVLSVTTGESTNGFTYDYYQGLRSWQNAYDDYSFQKCGDYIYVGQRGSYGHIIYLYDTSLKSITDGGNFQAAAPTIQTNQEDVFGVDCSNDFLYTIAFDGSNQVIREYSLSAWLSNSSIIAADTTKLGALSTQTKTQSAYSSSYYELNGFIYVNDNETLYKLQQGNSFTEIGTFTFTDSGQIVDFTSDDTYIYILTEAGLYKLNTNLNLAGSKLESSYITNFGSLTSPGKKEQFLFYNSYDRKLYQIKNSTLLLMIDPNTLNIDKEINLIKPLYGTKKYNFQIINDNYYINNNDDFTQCNLYSETCSVLFDLSTFVNYTGVYGNESAHTPIAKINDFIIYKGTLALPFDDFDNRMKFGFISGFEAQQELDDTWTINSVKTDKSEYIIKETALVTVNATHSISNDLLLYSIQCNDFSQKLWSEDFETLPSLNSTYNYINPANYSIQYNIDGIDDKVLSFEPHPFTNYNEINYTFPKAYNNKIRFGFKTSLSFIQPFYLKLYDSQNNKFLDINISISNDILTIIDNNNSEIIFLNFMEFNNTLISETNPLKQDGLLLDIDIFLDFQNNSYVIRTNNHEQVNYKFSQQKSLLYNSINLNKYSLNPFNSTFPFVQRTEILEAWVYNDRIPSFSSSNTGTCIFSKIGTYTIKAYVTSIFQPNNYIEYSTVSIYVRDSIPQDVGGAFDEMLELGGFKASFWKILMLIAFTLAILYGRGLWNDDMPDKDVGRIWIEFLFFETMMLWLLSYYLAFFPIQYFIIILLLDAATIAYYIKRMFD